MASSKPGTKRARDSSSRSSREKHALETLLQLTQLLTDSRPLEESLRAVTDAAIELVEANHASIRLLDATHTELLSGARSGDGETQRPMTFRRGEGVIGWVIDYREGACIPDVERDARFKTMAARQGFIIKSIVAEPLWSAGHVIGVLSVASAEEGAFDEDDQLLVRLLANCCAPPIERARLRRLAMTDDLTLAYNHRYFSPRFNEELERSRRTGQPVSVLVMDLDHFKQVNDTYGHAVGDAVLRTFADRVRSFVRKLDIFIRRGGEEFLLLMPATSLDQAKATAERIRKKIGERPFEIGSGEIVKQTVSMGIATWDGRESPEALEKRADKALYAAKEGGRDRVSIAASSDKSLLPAGVRGR